jgi:recombination protein RecA
MQAENLQRAIGDIHLKFGGQALVQASRLPAARPWGSGQTVVDRLSGIGGLAQGRVSVFQGTTGSGKLSLALAVLARATQEHARSLVLDQEMGFDPWVLGLFGADLDSLTIVRPPTPTVSGEAAVSLARAGAGFLLVLGALPEPALAPLESAAARSGCLALAVAGPTNTTDAAQRALAYASSLTLELEQVGWVWERGQVVGLRSLVRCVKNKLAAPGREGELEVRYPVDPSLPAVELVREIGTETDQVGSPPQLDRDSVVELWPSAAVG